MSVVSQIRDRQRRWAIRAGHKPNEKGYLGTIADNLWHPLSVQTRKEFERGKGSELRGDAKRPAKMRALHSSAALACNFFDFWRDRDKAVLSKALSLPETATSLS